ncbi:MAG: hypothetical protein QM696_00620 [Steroidobacteraceae bacterium]
MQTRNEVALEVVSRTAAVALAFATTFIVSAVTFSIITGEAEGARAVVATVFAPVRILLGV